MAVFVDNPEFGLPRSLEDSEIRNERRGWVSLVRGGPCGPSPFGRMEYVLDQLPVAPVGTPGVRERERMAAVPA